MQGSVAYDSGRGGLPVDMIAVDEVRDMELAYVNGRLSSVGGVTGGRMGGAEGDARVNGGEGLGL